MKITKELKGDFVVIHIDCPPASPFTRTVAVAALAEGTLKLAEEVQAAKQEAQKKVDNYLAVQKMLENE